MYEADATHWGTTSDEYLAARVYANAAINRWEMYDQTNWRELWTSLDDAASTVTKTVTAGTTSYTCPDNFIRPSSYVRIGTEFYNVKQLAQVPSLIQSDDHFCYFTGNVKAGFKLNFNPNLTLTTGGVIHYEYYKTATTFTTTTDTTEMSDPYFIVYFVLSRLHENDGEDGKASKAFQEAEARLEAMRTINMIGLEGVQDNIESTLSDMGGFGV